MPLEFPKVKVEVADPEERGLRMLHVPELNHPTPVRPSPFQSPVTGMPFPLKVKS
jgi:hypothetical protein